MPLAQNGQTGASFHQGENLSTPWKWASNIENQSQEDDALLKLL
jgi:hypothetical protein